MIWGSLPKLSSLSLPCLYDFCLYCFVPNTPYVCMVLCVCVCAHESACMWKSAVYVWFYVFAHVHMRTHACGSVFFYCFPHNSVRQGLSLGLEHTVQLGWLACKREIGLSLPPQQHWDF